MKKIKHKWYEHLFIKYKRVDAGNIIKEYEKNRLWVVITLTLILMLIAPIVILVIVCKDFKELTSYDDGTYGKEEYTIYRKDEIENEEVD